MIAHIRGIVTQRYLTSVVIDVQGVGYEIYATAQTLAACRENEEIQLETVLIVREDAHILYGFMHQDEKHVFQVLISTQGIGPKVALAILSILTPDELRYAVANEDEATLTRVPGVGKKTAKQMIVNIGTKLGEPHSAPAQELSSSHASCEPHHETVVNALVGLGWNIQQARAAVSECEKTMADAPDSDILRSALQILGGQRV